jgi:hypothetical protein
MKSMMTNPMRDPAQSNQADESDSALSALLDGELGDQAARPILKRLSRDGAELSQFPGVLRHRRRVARSGPRHAGPDQPRHGRPGR